MMRLGTREQRSLLVLIVTFVALWGLGTLAWLHAEPGLTGMEAFYRSLQMFSLNFTEPSHGVPPLLETARFAQPAFTILAFAATVSAQLRLVLRAIVSRGAEQVTIIGYGVAGKAAAERFRSSRPDARIVALDSRVSAADARTARRHGVELIECDVSDSETRRSFPIGLARSREVIIACGADETNLSLLDELTAEFTGADPPARLWLHLGSHALAERLRESYGKAATGGPVVEFVEVADHAAQAVLLAHPLVPEARAAGLHRVHVVVHGLDDFGWLCAEQALLNGIFPAPTYARPKVSVIVRDAIDARRTWSTRHAGLADQFDISFHASDVGAVCWTDANDDVLAAIECDHPPSLHIFAGNDSEAALTSALALRDAMRRGARPTAPIAVRSDHRRLTGRDLTEPSGVMQHRLTIVDGYDTPASVFGVVGRVLEARARSFHSAYARQTDAPPFDRLPHTQRLSNRRASFHLLEKLRILGFENAWPADLAYGLDCAGLDWLRTLDAASRTDLDRLEYLRWRADRFIEGWRAGPRDSERRLRDGLRGEPTTSAPFGAGEQAKDRTQLEDFIASAVAAEGSAGARIAEHTWEGEPPRWTVDDGVLSLSWADGTVPPLASSAESLARLRLLVPPAPESGLGADQLATQTRDALQSFGERFLSDHPAARLRFVRPATAPWNWLPPIADGRIDGVTLPRFTIGFTGHRDRARLGNVDTMIVELWDELALGPVTGLVPHLDHGGASSGNGARVPDHILRLCTAVEHPDAAHGAAADDRHAAVGEAILERATMLIAVSDGVYGGPGGVEDLVRRARDRRMLVRYLATST